MVKTAPYGTWTSPIPAQVVAAQGLRLGFPSIDGDDIYWLEGRPAESGRSVLVRRTPDGTTADVTPADTNVRTRVHEYGGGAYLVANGTAYYSNFADQRVYRILVRGRGEGGRGKEEAERGTVREALTPDGAWFYADFDLDRRRQRLVCVREDHTDATREAVTTIVSIPVGAATAEAPTVLASGYDFYSTPRLSPDGSRLSWICWRHPNMPWDGTELWVADVTAAGALTNQRRIAGGDDESIYQPGWSPDGTLYFASDRSGWWQIYRSEGSDRSNRSSVPNAPNAPNVTNAPNLPNVTNVTNLPHAEFGRPQWLFGWASWAFAGPSRMVVTYARGGRWRVATLDPATGNVVDLPTTIEPGESLAAAPGAAVFVGGSPTMAQSVVRATLGPPEGGPHGHLLREPEILRSSSTLAIDSGYVSEPQTIEFPTAGGLTAHAFYYPPRNRDFAPPAGERPPLIVISHGGPTTATRPTLDLQIQFWTSRGFAVVDVNYGGSSGYGRAYRQRLNGQWGIVDVADCVNAARFLVSEGQADERRLAIRGGSAGGYTTLAALTFHPGVFGAGASYYGVSDIELLAKDTHKFESRYLDSLVGPYPEQQEVYRARSPIHFVDRLSCPLILLQGLEDKIVPPNQAEVMAAAVRAKGLPVALIMFEGEQHGFRRAGTIIRSLEAELYFYGVVFGFTPADRIEAIEISNAPVDSRQ